MLLTIGGSADAGALKLMLQSAKTARLRAARARRHAVVSPPPAPAVARDAHYVSCPCLQKLCASAPRPQAGVDNLVFVATDSAVLASLGDDRPQHAVPFDVEGGGLGRRLLKYTCIARLVSAGFGVLYASPATVVSS